jgi:cell division septation protein DedD
VALRREESPAPPTAQTLVTDPVIAAPEAIAAEPITAKPLDGKPTKPEGKPVADIGKAASSAIAAAEAKPAAAKPAATPATGGKLSVQIGIFSVEANAQRAAGQMSKGGVSASVKKEQSQGKTFWRVVAGPAANATERDVLLKKIKGLGYPDAYAVSK